MKERLSLTPGSPRFTARRVENPEDKVNPEEHETYMSGVRTFLSHHKGNVLVCYCEALIGLLCEFLVGWKIGNFAYWGLETC